MGTKQNIQYVSRFTHCTLNKLRSKKGLSLVESMMTAAIFSMVGLTMAAFLFFVHSTQRANAINMEVTNQARNVMDKMIWGFITIDDPNGEREGIRESKSYTITNGGTQLDYVGADDVTRSIRLNGQDIEYFEALNPGWVKLYDAPGGAADYDTNLLFQVSGSSSDVVDIQLVVGKRSARDWHYASMVTQTYIRN